MHPSDVRNTDSISQTVKQLNYSNCSINLRHVSMVTSALGGYSIITEEKCRDPVILHTVAWSIF